MEAAALSIEDAFGDLKDPRSRTPAHDLTEMLVVALCAVLAGADSWIGIELWGQAKLDWLRRYLPLPNGIPSHDTFGRVFAALNPKQFEACFIRWTSHLFPNLVDQVVAIDGKTVRGSHQRGQRAIHLVSAYGAGLGMVLGQVRTAEKSNEITAIPELLDALLLKGAIVTIDAMGCQQAIARQIVDGGADYVLAVKANQPHPLTQIDRALEAIEHLPPAKREQIVQEHHDVDKGHGRVETRHCTVIDWERLRKHTRDTCFSPWPHARSAVIIDAIREIGDSVATQRRYYVSSLPPDAARIAHAIRSHWAIENGAHWTLDMAFGEDQCRVRVKNAAQNFAILRRITLNLLRQDRTTKAGLKNRRMLACADDRYLAQLLGWRQL